MSMYYFGWFFYGIVGIVSNREQAFFNSKLGVGTKFYCKSNGIEYIKGN